MWFSVACSEGKKLTRVASNSCGVSAAQARCSRWFDQALFRAIARKWEVSMGPPAGARSAEDCECDRCRDRPRGYRVEATERRAHAEAAAGDARIQERPAQHAEPREIRDARERQQREEGAP